MIKAHQKDAAMLGCCRNIPCFSIATQAGAKLEIFVDSQKTAPEMKTAMIGVGQKKIFSDQDKCRRNPENPEYDIQEPTA